MFQLYFINPNILQPATNERMVIMKNMKKSLGLVLIFTMCFTSAVFAVDTANTANLENEYLQAILNEIKEQGGYSDEEMATAEIISGSSTQQASLYSTSTESPLIEDAALKIETVEDNIIKSDYIIPYKIDEDGTLVNSFELISRSPDISFDGNISLVDATIFSTAYWQHRVWTQNNPSNVYHHIGITARWVSSSPRVYIDNLEVGYETNGIKTNFNTGVISNIELNKVSKIFEVAPVAGTLYSDWEHQMASDEGVVLTDAFRHKGIQYIEVNYAVDGKMQPFKRQMWTLYSKI